MFRDSVSVVSFVWDVQMLNDYEQRQLAQAVRVLEKPGFVMRAADLLGTPLEKAVGLLPDEAQVRIAQAAQQAVLGALRVSLRTLEYHDPALVEAPPAASNRRHLAMVAASGALGGLFGLPALLLELPLSTTLIMRSIADVARSEGADLQDYATQLECVQVLALGSASTQDDASEVGYLVAREAMAKAVSDAAVHLARHGVQKEGAPALLRLVLQVAERYSLTVSEKFLAQAMPLLGAAGGAAVNALFVSHFQDVARSHFTVRRLERVYGVERISEAYRAAYAELQASQAPRLRRITAT